MIDWRNILDAIRVEWKDRGANTSRGHVNVCCPWCNDDPSFHLRLSDEQGYYYCLRRPREHSGRNPISVLIRLGCSRADAVALLNEHDQDVKPRQIERPRQPAADQWERFASAATDDRYLDYLYHVRGFQNPARVAARYDLRYAETGKWAQRLLLPITFGDRVLSWTGRAILPAMRPKYLTDDVADEGLIYTPRPARETLIIVEGPMDALKVAAATEQAPICALALTGKQLNAPRLLRIREYAQGVRKVLVSLDRDTVLSESSSIISELSKALLRIEMSPYIKRLRLPTGVKDAAEMAEGDILPWIQSTTIR